MWLAVHWVQIISVLEALDPDRIQNPDVGSATFFRNLLSNTVSHPENGTWYPSVYLYRYTLLNYFL
jgi:hypothetical protein